MTRKYCGRVGGGLELADGEKCPECGYDGHESLSDAQCGAWVQCRYVIEPGDLAHGHACELNVGHVGAHFIDSSLHTDPNLHVTDE